MRRVLVTGGNKGIGLAIVRGVLERADDTFVLLGSRDPVRGAEARSRLVGANAGWADRVEVLELDVTDPGSVERAAKRVEEAHGSEAPLYGLVNNAGIAHGDLRPIVEVNVRGVHRVVQAFLPLLAEGGRVVNVTSAAGPSFVSDCSAERRRFLTDRNVTWEELDAFLEECVALAEQGGDFAAAGLGGGNAYGLSKAAANAYTLMLARERPSLRVNACTPGFIETDLTRPFAENRGTTPEAMGMKTPEEGARAPLHLLFAELEGNGRYYGSDCERSPFDRYRSPGDPPHTGEP